MAVELVVHELSKTFTTNRYQQDVLKDINYRFESGTSYAITGASGSGKSTLLSLLGGLDAPSHGTIYCQGRSIESMSAHARAAFFHKTVGFVFQFHYLVQELTVIENVMLKGLIDGCREHDCKQRAVELLEYVGLADKQHAYPRELSGGQQQRVSIARAIFNKPLFILADEPTGNLDAVNAQRVCDLLLHCVKDWGMGLIVGTHDALIYEQMDAVLTLVDGRLVQER